MTGGELRAALVTLNLTQSALARALGIEARQVRRWVKGEAPVAGPAVAWLGLALAIEGGRGIEEWAAQRAAASKGRGHP